LRVALLKRSLILIILAVVLAPVSPAFCGLPGPLPPAPPPIPTPPPDAGFDYVLLFPKAPAETFQVGFGTSLKDKIVMYGSAGNVLQYIEALEDDDWLLQVGGDQETIQAAYCGDGNNTLYQYGGQGVSSLYAEGRDGGNTIIQVGGQGDNDMGAAGGDGPDSIEQYGGPADNHLEVDGYFGDDVIAMYGGPGNNTFIYHVSDGNDQVTILGGGGERNQLTIYLEDLNMNFTLKDYQGRVLFRTGEGGTTITVANLRHIRAIRGIGEAETPIYTWPTPALPGIITPLLLD
jgi:hypothetical protein